MKLIQNFFLGMFLITCAHHSLLFAQTPSSTYEVHDIISGGKSKELWHTQTDKRYPGIFVTKRVMQMPQTVTTTETSIVHPNWWLRRIQTKDEALYYEEFLTSPPLHLDPGEGSFGYVNVRETKNDELVETWPLFIAVELYKGAKKVTFTIYMSKNRIMEVSRFYVNENYFFPFAQQLKIYKSGIDPKSVPMAGNPSTFFETYLVTSRTQ